MKPADFFLGVVNFLGVLVPGAVLLLVLIPRVPPAAWNPATSPIPSWLLFGGVAYVVGQLLLAATERVNDAAEPLARLVSRKLPDDVETFRKRASDHVELMRIGSRQAKFHTALSYCRARKAEAAAEVDHQMADYKLLRNLLAVLLIDLSVRAFVDSPAGGVLVLETVTFVLCLMAFVRTYCWAELLAFQYVCLLVEQPPVPSPQPPIPGPGR